MESPTGLDPTGASSVGRVARTPSAWRVALNEIVRATSVRGRTTIHSPGNGRCDDVCSAFFSDSFRYSCVRWPRYSIIIISRRVDDTVARAFRRTGRSFETGLRDSERRFSDCASRVRTEPVVVSQGRGSSRGVTDSGPSAAERTENASYGGLVADFACGSAGYRTGERASKRTDGRATATGARVNAEADRRTMTTAFVRGFCVRRPSLIKPGDPLRPPVCPSPRRTRRGATREFRRSRASGDPAQCRQPPDPSRPGGARRVSRTVITVPQRSRRTADRGYLTRSAATVRTAGPTTEYQPAAAAAVVHTSHYAGRTRYTVKRNETNAT